MGNEDEDINELRICMIYLKHKKLPHSCVTEHYPIGSARFSYHSHIKRMLWHKINYLRIWLNIQINPCNY